MSIALTPEQQNALDSHSDTLPRVRDPRTNTEYVLVPANEYEQVRETLEDERRQRAIRAVGLRNAAGRLLESP